MVGIEEWLVFLVAEVPHLVGAVAKSSLFRWSAQMGFVCVMDIQNLIDTIKNDSS